MIKFTDRFEKAVSAILLGFAMFIVFYQVVALIWNTVGSFSERFSKSGLDYAPEYGRTIAVMFFNILLLLEIMQTIKVFNKSHIVKVRIILIVCLVAASRKILELGEHEVSPMGLISLAALILALATGYFLVSKTATGTMEPMEKEED